MRCGARESRTCLGSGEWARRGDVRLEGCYSCTHSSLSQSCNLQSPILAVRKLHLLTKRREKTRRFETKAGLNDSSREHKLHML